MRVADMKELGILKKNSWALEAPEEFPGAKKWFKFDFWKTPH